MSVGSGHDSNSKISLGQSMSKRGIRQEYTRDQKIQLWETMVLTYIQDGLVTINDIKSQGEKAADLLNNSQQAFIQFLERPCNKQDKITEFINSFNKFSEEFPDLRKDDQTKDELLSRVETLSNSLWAITEQRKEESLQEIQNLAKGGWSDVEMKQTVKNMANLIEIEIKRFSVIYQIINGMEPPIELDAEIMTKRMIERGVQSYDGETKSSPVLNQVIVSLVSKLDELFAKHTNKGED